MSVKDVFQCQPNYGTVTNPSPSADIVSPDEYSVTFETNVLINGIPASPIVMSVKRSWAPLGADRFYSLVKDRYYDCAAFFRVVPGFVLQFGIAAIPVETIKWDSTIPDDLVMISNSPWTVSYATGGPDTRTTQLFINYINNSRLDSFGFAPFALITSGFETASAVFNPTPGDSDGVDQDLYYELGNNWIFQNYSNISLITSTYISDPASTAAVLRNQSWKELRVSITVLIFLGAIVGIACRRHQRSYSLLQTKKLPSDTSDDDALLRSDSTSKL